MNSDDVRADGMPREIAFDSRLGLRTRAPGEASGRLGLALVAVALVILFSALNATFFRVENFITIGMAKT